MTTLVKKKEGESKKMDENRFWLRMWGMIFLFVLIFTFMCLKNCSGGQNSNSCSSYYQDYYKLSKNKVTPPNPEGQDIQVITDSNKNIVYVVTVYYPSGIVKYLANIDQYSLLARMNYNSIFFWDIKNQKMIFISNIPFKVERPSATKSSDFDKRIADDLSKEAEKSV